MGLTVVIIGIQESYICFKIKSFVSQEITVCLHKNECERSGLIIYIT